MENIKAIVILEIMGRPPEYVKESAEALVKKIEEDKLIKIEKSRIADLKKLEKNELFSTFAELEISADNLINLTEFMFMYMPAHVEILEPKSLAIENFDLNNLLNSLLMKLHRYDELAKILSFEKQILVKQINEMKKSSGIKLEKPAPVEFAPIAKEKSEKKAGKKGKKK